MKLKLRKADVIKKIGKFWDFLNKPLSVTIIAFLGLFLLTTLYGENYKVNPDVNYLKNQMNMSQDMVDAFVDLYSVPLRENWTFDSYQEALAYKSLTEDAIRARTNEPTWYAITLVCDEKKIPLPLEIKDVLNKLS